MTSTQGLARPFMGIRATWITDERKRYTVIRYRSIWEDGTPGPDYATDKVGEFPTFEAASDAIDTHPQYAACDTWEDVLNVLPSAPWGVRTYRATSGRWVVKWYAY